VAADDGEKLIDTPADGDDGAGLMTISNSFAAASEIQQRSGDDQMAGQTPEGIRSGPQPGRGSLGR
jgi:hypothetical protein